MKIAPRSSAVLVCASLLGLAGAASAFHRETPPVTALTTSGDTDLPRIPSQGRRLLALETGSSIMAVLPFKTEAAPTPVADSGRDPAVAFNGRTVAFETNDDPLASGRPGWQIVLSREGELLEAVADPSGTSAKPSLDKRGTTLVFESAGDLTNLGTPGINRVYVRFKDGSLATVSSGLGTSGNAMLASTGDLVVFESTSDPETGADTGISQIWAGRITNLPAAPITDGLGPSTGPIVSDDGRLVVFVSQAALASSDGADTGVPQVFLYDTKSRTYAQVTNEPGGCTRPGVAKVRKDWRVTFVCDGQAYYHMLRQNVRYHVSTPDGSTQAIIPEMGVHFLLVSTTADLVSGSGTTAGHQIYLLNLFAQSIPTVPGSVTWFPTQGIPGL